MIFLFLHKYLKEDHLLMLNLSVNYINFDHINVTNDLSIQDHYIQYFDQVEIDKSFVDNIFVLVYILPFQLRFFQVNVNLFHHQFFPSYDQMFLFNRNHLHQLILYVQSKFFFWFIFTNGLNKNVIFIIKIT